MKKIASIYRLPISLVVMAALLGGCLQPAKTSRSPGEEASDDEERRFDPLELSRDREIIPEIYPQDDVIRGSQQLAATGEDTAEVAEVRLPDEVEEVDTVYTQAFRVQLATSKVYGEARQEVRVAEEIFDRPVYLDYEVPYYKLRVGSFRDREQAEQYQQRARAAGYDNAWVVLVNVDVKEPEPLYRDHPLPTVVDTTQAGDTLDAD